jgi:hypothetical protein
MSDYLLTIASFLMQLVVAVISLLIYGCLVGLVVFAFLYIGVRLFRWTRGRWILCTARSRG